jgi:hypothetical protein
VLLVVAHRLSGVLRETAARAEIAGVVLIKVLKIALGRTRELSQ